MTGFFMEHVAGACPIGSAVSSALAFAGDGANAGRKWRRRIHRLLHPDVMKCKTTATQGRESQQSGRDPEIQAVNLYDVTRLKYL